MNFKTKINSKIATYFKRRYFNVDAFLEDHKNKDSNEQREILKNIFPKIKKLENLSELNLEFLETDFFKIDGDMICCLKYQCAVNGDLYKGPINYLKSQGISVKRNPLLLRLSQDAYVSSFGRRDVIVTIKKHDLRIKIEFYQAQQ